jgi:dUTP pyrophosphatase
MNVKLTLENAKLPKRTNPTDAGADLFSPVKVQIPPHESVFIDLGVQMELQEGTVGLIFARSGLGSKHGIRPRNCVGVIDAKYRDNIGIMVENASEDYYEIEVGDRIAQIVIVPILTPDFQIVDELDIEGARNGGFGNSGK